MIIKCKCTHSAQDSLHGRKMRVHNKTKSGRWRCTVCLDMKDVTKKEETK